MDALKTTAIALAMLGVILVSQQPARSQEDAPVVSLQQPISLVSSKPACVSCTAGLPCGDHESTVPAAEPIVSFATLVESDGLAESDRLVESDASDVSLASAHSEVAVSPSCGAAHGGGAVAACGPSCSTCGATDECVGLFTAPGGVTWSTCSNGCKHGCFGEGGCKLRRKCSGEGCGGSCGPACQDWTCLDLCCRRGFWIRTDALGWWAKDDEIPTLVTGSPLGTPIDDVGVLGLPTTSELFNSPLYDDFRFGGRVRFGWWATNCRCGLAGSIWGIENESNELSWSSAGNPAYARPFFNADPLIDGPDAELVSFDGTLDGAVTVNSSSEVLGADLGLRCNVLCCTDVCGSRSTRLDVFAGYRYFKVREGVRVTEDLESIALTGPTVLGTTIDLFDDFRTRNEFHGANFGIMAAKQHGCWTGELYTGVGVGSIARKVSVSGQTTVTVPGLAPVTRAGGLLAQPTNIGNYEDCEFAILPEVRADLGYNFNCHLKFLVGYTFMYLGDVVRPGDIIDPTVNGLQLDPTLPLVGPERPQFAWRDSDMWLMGLNLGLEYTF